MRGQDVDNLVLTKSKNLPSTFKTDLEYPLNYQKHYDLLIIKSQSRIKPNCYCEHHHILPKALGGSNDVSNLVWLTAREHCFAHILLAKIHGGAMWIAVYLMLNKNSTKSSKLYAVIKQKSLEASRHYNFKGSIFATNIKSNETFELKSKQDIKNLGLNSSTIYSCLLEKRKTHKGFKFYRNLILPPSHIYIFDFL